MTINRLNPRDATEGQLPQRPRRIDKAGVPVWIWLLCGAFGVLLMMGCAGVVGALLLFRSDWIADKIHSPYNARVTEENYNKIRLGMTAAEVKAILGEPNATAEAYEDAMESGDDPRDSGGRMMRWKNGANYIQVRLDSSNRVIGIGYQYSDRGR
jgi:hypothetical protein